MEPHAVRVRVRVVPGARRACVVGRHGPGWKVTVTAPPDRGRANDAVAALIATSVGIPKRDVAIVSGRSVRDKVVELRGVTAAEVEQRLAAGEETS
jgi:uncharacterized protein